MDWDSLGRRRRAEQHGTEPASVDFSDLTPEERRERTRARRRATEELESLDLALADLIREFKRLEIAQRDARYREFETRVEERVARTRGTIDSAAESSVVDAVAVSRFRALNALGPRPTAGAVRRQSRPSALRNGERPKGEHEQSKPREKKKTRIRKKAKTRNPRNPLAGGVVTLKLEIGTPAGLLKVRWPPCPGVDQWNVRIGRHDAVVRQATYPGATRRVLVRLDDTVEGRVEVVVEGSSAGRTLARGESWAFLS